MSASALAAYFRQEARAEIAEKKQEKANAAKFEAIVTPYIQRGISFDEFMAAEQCPSSFREAYRQIEEKYQRKHQPTPEQVELQKLESEAAAAMGLSSDPQPEQVGGYQGADFFSAVAQAAQVRKDRARRRCFGIGGTASESPAEPDEDDPSPDDDPVEPEDDPSPEDDPDSESAPESPESPEDNPTSPEDSTEPEHGEPSDNA